jgi:hypothetical protein
MSDVAVSAPPISGVSDFQRKGYKILLRRNRVGGPKTNVACVVKFFLLMEAHSLLKLFTGFVIAAFMDS